MSCLQMKFRWLTSLKPLLWYCENRLSLNCPSWTFLYAIKMQNVLHQLYSKVSASEMFLTSKRWQFWLGLHKKGLEHNVGWGFWLLVPETLEASDPPPRLWTARLKDTERTNSTFVVTTQLVNMSIWNLQNLSTWSKGAHATVSSECDGFSLDHFLWLPFWSDACSIFASFCIFCRVTEWSCSSWRRKHSSSCWERAWKHNSSGA